MRVNRREFFKVAAAAGATLAVSGCGQDPAPAGGADPGASSSGLPTGAWFEQLRADLRAASYGSPHVIIDLDRLDANADSIVAEIGLDRFRLVEKSLPSIDLLSYLQKRTGVNRFLVLHLPFLPALLDAFPTADVLVGKVQPTAAVNRFFQDLAPADRAAAAARVRFLVDSPARLEELVALARNFAVTLQVGVEIDVGLHRGGVRRVGELPAVLTGFLVNPALVRFSGLLGYDGHVTAAPGGPGLEEYTARATYAAFVRIYDAFIAVVKSDFPSLWRDDLIFNSGGTETYALHHGGPANDVAAGGGMLRPASYSSMFIGALRPAVFIAAPVIAQCPTFELPFGPGQSTELFDGNQSFTMVGGGWPAPPVWPADVQAAPIESDPEGTNLVSNESLMVAPASLAIGPGDWIFFQPRKADAIFLFESILLVRGGRLQSETWRSYPRRY